MSGLPEGWVRTRLGDVVDYANTTKVEPRGIQGDAWLLELEDIEKGTSKLLQRLSFSERRSKSTKNEFQQGDILYGKLRPYLDKVIIAQESGYCSTEIVPIRPSVDLDRRYLFYCLKTKEFLDYVTDVSHGQSMPRLGTQQAKNAPVVLAPFNEQIRIANKLDSIFSKIDKAQTHLEKVPTILKRFRQSVLAAAVNGQLTEEWRGESSYEKITGNLAAPISWVKSTIDELADYVTSGSRGWAKYYSEEGSVFVRSQDINTDELRITDAAFVSLPEKVEGRRTKIRKEDLLITITGANVTKCARVADDLEDAYISQHVALIRLKNSSVAKFVELALKAENAGRKQLTEMAYGGGKPGLNLQNIKDVMFSMPPLEEQEEIMKRVSLLLASVEKFELRYMKAKLQVDRLTQSTLARSFRGELVPQDPKDESAETLLVKIKSAMPKAKVKTEK